MRKKSKGFIGACTLALLLAPGCSKSQSETDKKLAELQAQLEQQKKELDAAKAGQTSDPAAAPAQGGAQSGQGAAPATGGASKGSGSSKAGGSELSQQVSSNKSDIAANKAAIATDSANIQTNKEGIATNKDAIATNKANIETNRQGVEEAKKMAAPAAYHTIPGGTVIQVRTGGAISTKTSAQGSLFEATLVEPLVVDGYTIAESGSPVEGIVTNADPGGRVKGVATISVALRSVMMADGRRLPLKTSSKTFDANKSGKKDALKVGIGAGLGAAIGAIAGGGKGAAIGAAAGGGGGTALALGTRGDAATIPSETVLDLPLSSAVRVQELKK